MSGRLVSCVFESRLPHRLKSLAAVLASFGRDDGSSIRPSIARVARLWGRSERRVQAALTDLQRIGVLVVVRAHAPRRPTEYRIDLVVSDAVLVEVKCAERLHPVFEAQLLTYLRLTGKRVGLLVNFNSRLLKEGIKRLIL